MQRIWIILLWLIGGSTVQAQTFEEWFRQKETQIKYLEEQIVALKGYGELVNKGYEIARGGLASIFNSKEEDDRQHRDYLNSLWEVKQSIRNDPRVTSVMNMSAAVRNWRIRELYSPHLSYGEKTYIKSVFKNLADECLHLSEELDKVVSNGQLQMRDDERIGRIDNIYLVMMGLYGSFQSFAGEVSGLVRGRKREEILNNKWYSLYHIQKDK